MSLAANLVLLAQAIGLDIKDVNAKIGTMSSLTTTEKTTIVGALNELDSKIGALINDALSTSTTKTWSIDKIVQSINQAKSDILGGLPSAALDTIYELSQAIENDGVNITGILTSLGLRVRVDAAQNFSVGEKLQGRQNIDAASDTEFQQFKTDVGSTSEDFVAAYNLAKA